MHPYQCELVDPLLPHPGDDGTPSPLAPGSEWSKIAFVTLHDLKTKGLDVDPDGIRTGRSKCKQYFIADPDGVRIELMQLMPESNQAQALNN